MTRYDTLPRFHDVVKERTFTLGSRILPKQQEINANYQMIT